MSKVVQSHYAYRLVPTTVWPDHTGIYYHDDTKNPIQLLYAKPRRMVRHGEPVFKTQKQLGSRALVSDTWSRNLGWASFSYYGAGGLEPGYGNYAHRQGYNVLYGDWSAQWYEDADRQIMWWPDIADHPGWHGTYYYTLAMNVVTDYYTLNETPPVRHPPTGMRGAVAVWHRLDTHNGVDVGVDIAE
jgi:hypothetical protein